MALPNGAHTLAPTLQIESYQTVTPCKVTSPGETRKVSLTDPVGEGILGGCLNMVLLYKKAAAEDSGWLAAGWIKESLGRALRDQPMLSGRLRRGDDGEAEIVANDSGTRLVEAKIATSLQDFLDLKEEIRRTVEANLVFWRDIDDQNPQFSPLFYVQVTNFECGGYSIGISCSLLLADLLITDNFLLRWAKFHKEILSKKDAGQVPFFYLPSLKAPTLCANGVITLAPSSSCGHTLIFNIPQGKTMDLKDLALLCIEEAVCKVDIKMPSEFSLLAKDPHDDKCVKVQNCRTHDLVESQAKDTTSQATATCISWDELGLIEVAFYQGNRPVHVSGWTGSILGGLVVGVGSSSGGTSEMNIIVTIPN